MLAVYLASASASWEWAGLVLALGIVGGLSGLAGSRARRLLVGLFVVGVVAYGATVAQAVYVPCPWEWRWLGIC